MTWHQVLENGSYIAGNVEVTEGFMRFRGKILRMEMNSEQNIFTFVLEWCAQKTTACRHDDYMWDLCVDPDRARISFGCDDVGIPRVQDGNCLRFSILRTNTTSESSVNPVLVMPSGYKSNTDGILSPEFVRGLQRRMAN